MGCAQSRIENEEAVARCKERRQLMKAAVAARNAFAAAHSAYAASLKDTGAALSEFAHGEGLPPPPPPPGASAETAAPVAAQGGIGAAAAGASASGADAIMPPPPPLDSLPPPPPPLPDFSPSPAKIHRSISMPLPPSSGNKNPAMLHSDSIREEEEDEDEAEREEDDGHLDDRRQRLRHRPPVPPPLSPPPPPETPVTPQPPPPPPPPSSEMKAGVDTWDYFFSMDDGMASIAPEDEEIMAEPEPPLPPRPPHSPPLAAVPLSEEFEEEPRTPEMATPPASLPPKPPKHSSRKKGKGKLKAAHHQHTESAPPVTLVTGGKAGKVVHAEMPRVDLLRVLAQIDERFLKASESAGEVSKALEANRMHYHSNFADNRGQ